MGGELREVQLQRGGGRTSQIILSDGPETTYLILLYKRTLSQVRFVRDDSHL